MTALKQFEPGVHYDLPAEDYHSAVGVSHSMLKHMNPPARLPVYLTEKFEPTPAMLIGTHVHNAILTPNEPLPGIVVAPEDMKFNTKEGKAWKVVQDPKLIVVKHDDFTTINGCIKSIAASPTCREIFKEGKAEVSCFDWDWRQKFKFMKKCRIDFVPVGDSLVDIKTVRDEGGLPEEWQKIMYDERYYTQAAYYLKMWNMLNEHDQKTHFTFIVVEKIPPYLVAVYYVDEATLALGDNRNESDLTRFMTCSRDGVWPGYPDAPTKIGIPVWASKRESERQHNEWESSIP